MSTPISRKRPLGVTVRGLLYVIEGVVAVFFGVLLSTTSQYLTTYLNRFADSKEISATLDILNGDFSHVLVIWLVVAGGAGIIIGVGILGGKGWAWKITIIQTLLSTAIGVVYFTLLLNTPDVISKVIGTSLELIIGIVLVGYFYQPHVRAYFNKISSK